jgi:hypothetical protein
VQRGLASSASSWASRWYFTERPVGGGRQRQALGARDTASATVHCAPRHRGPPPGRRRGAVGVRAGDSTSTPRRALSSARRNRRAHQDSKQPRGIRFGARGQARRRAPRRGQLILPTGRDDEIGLALRLRGGRPRDHGRARRRTRRAGGRRSTARYGPRAWSAARRHAGVAGEIEELLAPPTNGAARAARGPRRRSRPPARALAQPAPARWASELPEQVEPESAIVHLGPVRGETCAPRLGRRIPRLDPRGPVAQLARAGADRAIPARRRAGGGGRTLRAIVLNETERASCAELIARGLEGGDGRDHGGCGRRRLLFGSGRGWRPRAHGSGTRRTTWGRVTSAPPCSWRSRRAAARGRRFAAAAAATRLSGVGAAAIGGRSAIEARLAAG